MNDLHLCVEEKHFYSSILRAEKASESREKTIWKNMVTLQSILNSYKFVIVLTIGEYSSLFYLLRSEKVKTVFPRRGGWGGAKGLSPLGLLSVKGFQTA